MMSKCGRTMAAGMLALGMLLAGWAGAQVTVSNVLAEQRVNTDLVDIHFDLHKGGISDDITFPIMLVITDGDEPVSSASATGMVTAGVDRHIVWDAAADWGMYKGSTNMSFTVKVSAEASVPEGGDATATGWQSHQRALGQQLLCRRGGHYERPGCWSGLHV